MDNVIDAERLMALGCPWALAEEIIEAILASGGSQNLSLSGITGNVFLGALPENSWLLRLLIRDNNHFGGMIGLGTALGAVNILPLQAVVAAGTYSLTVDASTFSVGSFASGATPSIYVTTTGGGSSFTVQLDYEGGP